MGQMEQRATGPRIDAKTGLTLPLSASLDWQDLARHRAMVGLELEVLAKKFDRFGWERDSGTPVHDRMITDWMDALQDFTLDEIQAACRACVIADPKRMPNEGAVLGRIMDARRLHVAALPRPAEPPRFSANAVPVQDRRAAAARIFAETGFAKRIGGGA